jgi:hypothetical protein
MKFSPSDEGVVLVFIFKRGYSDIVLFLLPTAFLPEQLGLLLISKGPAKVNRLCKHFACGKQKPVFGTGFVCFLLRGALRQKL